MINIGLFEVDWMFNIISGIFWMRTKVFFVLANHVGGFCEWQMEY